MIDSRHSRKLVLAITSPCWSLTKVAYLDDRAMLIEVASKMGIVGIQHTAYDSTKTRLAKLGLPL